MKDHTTENIKANKNGEMFEKDQLWYHDKEKFPRYYAAFNRDDILNEVFRRVEPQKRTMGEYLREEILPNFGIEIFSGMKESELEKRFPFDLMGTWKMIKMMLDGPGNCPIGTSIGEISDQ